MAKELKRKIYLSGPGGRARGGEGEVRFELSRQTGLRPKPKGKENEHE